MFRIFTSSLPIGLCCFLSTLALHHTLILSLVTDLQESSLILWCAYWNGAYYTCLFIFVRVITLDRINAIVHDGNKIKDLG